MLYKVKVALHQIWDQEVWRRAIQLNRIKVILMFLEVIFLLVENLFRKIMLMQVLSQKNSRVWHLKFRKH